MHKEINEALTHKLEQAKDLYYRLVLLVGTSGSGKTETLRSYASGLGTEVLNVNLLVSEKLLDLSNKQRSMQLSRVLHEILDSYTDTPLILDNLELLFDTSLQQDPLRLLQSISRNRTVLASWNGTMKDGRLTYADISHEEYRTYDQIDALTLLAEA